MSVRPPGWHCGFAAAPLFLPARLLASPLLWHQAAALHS